MTKYIKFITKPDTWFIENQEVYLTDFDHRRPTLEEYEEYMKGLENSGMCNFCGFCDYGRGYIEKDSEICQLEEFEILIVEDAKRD